MKWKLCFNAVKCKVLTLRRSQMHAIFEYKLTGAKLNRVNSIKDLGVILDVNMNWNCYIKSIVTGANRMLGLIKRAVGYNVVVSVKRQLYVSLVRIELEYCSPVCSGLTKRMCEGLSAFKRVTF